MFMPFARSEDSMPDASGFSEDHHLVPAPSDRKTTVPVGDPLISTLMNAGTDLGMVGQRMSRAVQVDPAGQVGSIFDVTVAVPKGSDATPGSPAASARTPAARATREASATIWNTQDRL